MPESECGHNFEDAEHAASHVRESGPAGTNHDERRRQKKYQQEEKVIRAFGDVPHAETEDADETERTERAAEVCPPLAKGRARSTASLHIIQLVERLPFIPSLSDDADVGVAWNQTIYEVSCVRGSDDCSEE